MAKTRRIHMTKESHDETFLDGLPAPFGVGSAAARSLRPFRKMEVRPAFGT
jgi:hypothetical protein